MKHWHRRLGLTLCALLVLISVTGSLLLLKREYLWLTVPEARHEVAVNALPAVLEKLDQALGSEWSFLSANIQNLSIHKVFMHDRSYLLLSSQGELLDHWRGNERFEDWLLDLHHRLLLGNAFGLNAVGFTGLLLMLLVYLGVRLWWPRKRFFRYGIWLKHKQHGDTQRSHANLGAIVALPSLLIAITGVILVYPNESRWIFQNGFSTDAPSPHTESVKIEGGLAWQWQAQIQFVQKEYNVAKIAWAMPISDHANYRAIGFQEGDAFQGVSASSVRFYKNGAIVYKPARKQALGTRGLDLIYPLHIGTINTAYRYAMLTFGIGLAALSLLGLLSYWRGRTR